MSLGVSVGLPVVLEHKGKSYTCARPDHIRVVSEFSDHLRQTALGEVEKVRMAFGPVAGEVAMGAYLDKAAALVYDFGSPFWFQALQHARHQSAMLLACLRVHHAEATRALAEEILKDDPAGAARVIFGTAGDTLAGNELPAAG